MKISTNYSRKLIALSLVSLFAMPAFAQRHAMNEPFGDSTHKDKTATSRDITFGFFSPINQHLTFGYEQPINYQMTFATQLGIIGAGFNLNGNNYGYGYSGPKPFGLFVSCGLKLFPNPDYTMHGMTRFNAMQGFYFMPEIVVGDFNYTLTNYNYWNNGGTTTTYNITNYALILNLGKQWVFVRHFLLNIHAGVGYGSATVKGGPSQQQYPYSTPYNTSDLTGGNYYDYVSLGELISFSAGVDIGVVF